MRTGLRTPTLLLAGLLAIQAAQAADPDLRSGESASAAARPLAALFRNSGPETFRKAVAGISDIRVYEGLPDPGTERTLYAREKARGDILVLGNRDFYAAPMQIAAADLEMIRAAFHPGNPFSSGGGMDPCGRFHADYAIVWKDGGTEYLAQIGLGCQEIHASGPSIDIHSYIPPEIYAGLQRALGKYSVNRPSGDSPAAR